MAAVVLLVLVVGTAADATTRIVPLGDSITKGMLHADDGGSHPTYRYWLWQKLRSNGYDVDFVGSWSEPNFPGYSFDQQNEGHGGYTIGGILNGVSDDPSHYLSTWLQSYSPDMAMIILGTNDVLANTPMSTRFSNLNGVVQTLRNRNSNIKIFLAKLPPTGDDYRNQNSGLITFNNQLPSWASARSTSQSPIIVVDLYSGYDGIADNQASRYLHPDESGERKIADRFYSAITPYLSTGTPVTAVPTPTPNPYAISGSRTIDKAGSYYLTKDIINSDENVCIDVKVPDVTIDGKGYTVDGIGGNTQAGIVVSPGANRVTIKNVRLTDWAYAVYYTGASDGRIEGCTIDRSSWGGIVMNIDANRNTVTGNRVTGSQFAIYVRDSTGSRIYNNRFSAPTNAYPYGNTAGTTWSVAKLSGPNVIGGASIGGNYWGSPAGTGFSETRVDANRDGFIDERYEPVAGQYDLLPLAASTAPSGTPGPYQTLVVPGMIEAEDYDVGGEGVAYHDTVAGNQGGAYRSDDVDIESITGGYTLAYIRDSEWTRYTVTVQQAGDYRVGFRAAAWNAPRTVRILAGTTEIGNVTVPVTGSPTTFTTATTTVRLGAGTQTLRFAYTGDGMNLDRIETALVTPTATPTPTPTTVPVAPFPAAHPLPALVQAEHFDAGGEGAAYHDYEPANLGNDQALRPGEGVDIETDGAVTDVCFVRAGEYLKYSVDSTIAGNFTLTLRAANPDAITKAVKVSLDGVPAGDVLVGGTGGWTAYSDFTASAPLTIPAGRHVVTLAFEGIDRLNLDWLSLAAAAPSPTPIPTPTANATETVTPTPTVNETATTTPTVNATPTATVSVSVTPTPTGNVTPTVTETPTTGVLPVPGGAGAPTDPNGDGLYDDVNGNGRKDFADVVLYFNSVDWIAANEPVPAFDYNANGRVDFADIAWLFDHL